MKSDSEILEKVGLLGEEFMERSRRGEKPTIREYVERYPQYANQIRELFPSLAMLEELSPDNTESFGLPRQSGCLHDAVRQIGDFRVIREVGRGGMGIVYEAEQESLGRHVALKVLPSNLLPDAKQRIRFEREAKSAGQLHHTNIVPVFGVGQDNGLHYYAMQFIQGLGLDDVLEELRRFKASGGVSKGDVQIDVSNLSARDPGAPEPSLAVTAIAQTLLEPSAATGASAEPPVAVSSPIPDQTRDCERTATSGRTRPNATSDDTSAARSTATFMLQDGGFDSTVSSTSVKLPGTSHGRNSSGKAATYWQSVANIGVQVGSALQYAHDQGVTHRDIKPANLLLDLRGCVWVTDFGLAKAEGSENLTHTGDILGTLRYMPPEAFEGQSDHRGDIYSLGLTLYEMLALRPAYAASDRNSLIKCVMQANVDPLGNVDPEIPRDLTTIVHKAIAADADQRYQTAGELSDDLQRFLADEPIHARRVSLWERGTRWAKRNQGLAASIATVASLLLVIAIGSTIAAIRFQQISNNLSDARTEKAIEAARNLRLADAESAAKELAIASKEESHHNFEKALAAVESYLDKVTEDKLLAVPGMQPLRNELLQSALAFYKDFASQDIESPALQRKLASALTRIGRITSELGDPEEAEEYHLRAREILTAIDAENSSYISLQIDLANHHEAYGRLLTQRGEVKRGLDELSTAEEIFESVASVNEELRHKQIRVLTEMSDAEQDVGNAQDAFSICERMISLIDLQMQDLSAAAGPSARQAWSFQLANAKTNFAKLHELIGYERIRQNAVGMEERPVRELYNEAIELQTELIDFGPGFIPSNDLYRAHANTLIAQARHSLRLGEEAEALNSLQTAAKFHRKLVAENPAVPDNKFDLAEVLVEIGSVHRRLGNSVQAKSHYTDGVKILLQLDDTVARRNTVLVEHILSLCDLWLEEGEFRAATRFLEEAGDLLVQIREPSAGLVFDFAKAWCECQQFEAESREKDDGGGKQFASHEVPLARLEQAVDLGFKDYNKLVSTPEFECLADEERFQRIKQRVKQAHEDRGWQTDLVKARQIAIDRGKNLLIFFDASDWCVYCATIRKQVLEHQDFLDTVSKYFVLVNLDSPEGPKPEFHQRNDELRRKWNVTGFPKFVYCDPDLRRIHERQGGGTVDLWIEEVNFIAEVFTERDRALSKMDSSNGGDKLRHIAKALNHINPKYHAPDYPELRETLDEFIASGPHDLDLESADPSLLKSIAAGHRQLSERLEDEKERRKHAEYARELYRHLHKLDPDDLKIAMEHAGETLLQLRDNQSDWPDDWRRRERLVLPSLDRSQPALFIASVEYLQGNRSNAISVLRKAEEISVESQLLMTLALLEQGQDQEAKQAFESAWTEIETRGLKSLSDDLGLKFIAFCERWPEICSPPRRAAMLLQKGDLLAGKKIYVELARQDPRNEEWSRRLGQLTDQTMATKNFDLGPESTSVFGAGIDVGDEGILMLSTSPAPVCSIDFWGPKLQLQPGLYELSLRMKHSAPISFVMSGSGSQSQAFFTKMELPSNSSMTDHRIVFALDDPNRGLGVTALGGLPCNLHIDSVTLKRSSESEAKEWIESARDHELPQIALLSAELHYRDAVKQEMAGDTAAAIKDLRIAEAVASEVIAPFWNVDIDAHANFELMRRAIQHESAAKLLFKIKYAKHRLVGGERVIPEFAYVGAGNAFGPLKFLCLAYSYAAEDQPNRAETLVRLPQKFIGTLPDNISNLIQFRLAEFYNWNKDRDECLRWTRSGIETIRQQGRSASNGEFALEIISKALELDPEAADLLAARAELLAICNRHDELQGALQNWLAKNPEAESTELYRRLQDELLLPGGPSDQESNLTWHEVSLEMEEHLEENNVMDSLPWMRNVALAAVAVQRGQAEQSRFENLASKMQQKFGRSSSAGDVERTLKACLLLESSLDVSHLLRGQLENPLQSGRINRDIKPFFELALGLSSLRAGDFKDSIIRCNAALQSARRAPAYKHVVDPAALAILSLALNQADRIEEAGQALATAKERLDELRANGVYFGDASGVSTTEMADHDAIIAMLLVEQAEEALRQQPSLK